MSAMTRRWTLAILALLVGVLTGCGVPAEQNPREIEPPPGPFPTFAAATPATPAQAETVERLCFVRDNKLVKVSRPAALPSTLAEQLRHLLSGPTAAERDQGITSALTGTPAVGSVETTGGAVTLDVGAAGDTGRSDEALAYGQIVCTLTGRSDVTGVTFVRDGQRLSVPRADGSLSEGPLTAVDYVDIMS